MSVRGWQVARAHGAPAFAFAQTALICHQPLKHGTARGLRSMPVSLYFMYLVSKVKLDLKILFDVIRGGWKLFEVWKIISRKFHRTRGLYFYDTYNVGLLHIA